MKKIITVFLSLCMIIGMLISPSAINFVSNVCAADTSETTSGTCGEELTWTLNSEGKLTISGKGPMKDSQFIYRQDITSVVIEDGVTSIENRAFRDCSNISSVTMADSVTSIGDYAFYGCHALTYVKLSASITSIPERCFAGYNELKSITIPVSVTDIGSAAFQSNEKLEAVIIPEGASRIGDYAFDSCKALESISIPSSVTNIEYCAFTGTKWLERRQNEDPLVIVNDILIDASKCSGKVVIPEGVKIIGGHSFACDTIESVTFPSSVKTICDKGFENCSSLTSITIPDSVTSIGLGAFEGCEKLESVTLPVSISKLPKDGFYCCKALTSLTILNPKAEFKEPFGAYPFSTNPDLVIYGYEYSTADDYANYFKLDFIPLDYDSYPIPATKYGDVNCDDNVDIEDAAILIGYLNGNDKITYQGRVNGDVYCPPSGLTKEDAKTIEDYVNGIVTALPVTTTSTTTTTTTTSTSTTTTTGTTSSETSTTTSTTTPETAPTTTPELQVTKAGDANCDGQVDMADAVLIMQALANPNKYGIGGTTEHAITEQGLVNADVDKTSIGLTSNDALKIQQWLLSIIKSF